MPVLPSFFLQAAAPAAGAASPMIFFVQIGVIIAIFYFIVLRPQRKQQKQLESALMTMTKGDDVVTAGGLVGEVVHIKETISDGKPQGSMADRVTIRTGESKVVVERGKIVRVSRQNAAG